MEQTIQQGIGAGRMKQIQFCLAICVVAVVFWLMTGIFMELKPGMTPEEQVQKASNVDKMLAQKHPLDATWEEILGKPNKQPQVPFPKQFQLGDVVSTDLQETENLAPSPTSISQIEQMTQDFATIQNENPIKFETLDLVANDKIPQNTTNAPKVQGQPGQVKQSESWMRPGEDPVVLEMTRIAMQKYNPEQQRLEELIAAYDITTLQKLFKLLEVGSIDAVQFHDLYKYTDLYTGISLAGVEDDEETRKKKEEEAKQTKHVPLVSKKDEWKEINEEQQRNHTNSMMAYLEKRNATFPELKNSIGDFPEPGENEQIFSMLLEPDPHPLPQDQLSWQPKLFGYTNEQAADVYQVDKVWGQCNEDWPDNVGYWDEDNKFVVNCTDTRYVDYLKGTHPKDERLGHVSFIPKLVRYLGPVQFDRQEFGFSRCDRTMRYGTLRNLRLEEASNRASETAQRIAEEVETKEFRPISIYLMVTDSVSRNHFYRSWPKTIEWLNNNVVQGEYSSDAVMYDFIINNAHGSNSIPNVTPLVFGYNETNHFLRTRDAGFKYDENKSKNKYLEIQKESLWGIAKELGFVTAFGFDTIYDYISRVTSRVLDVDHMLSNFYKGAKKVTNYNEWSNKQHWIGKHNSFWYMLDYVRQFHNNYKGNNRFVYMHNSAGHESSGSIIKTLDEDMQKFIADMAKYIRDNPQEDIVVMLTSDHGKGIDNHVHSHEGTIENKLPFHLMFANKSLIARFNAHNNLLHNTKRLISRYDWYMTMRHLMTAPYGFVSPQSEYYQAIRHFTDSSKTISLLSEKVPDDRTCEDMVIPDRICSCIEWISMTPKQAQDMRAVKDLLFLAQGAINNGIKNKEICQAVTFSEIVQADYQVFRDPNRGVRNLKIVVTIEENPVAQFEVHGLMAPQETMKTNNLINEIDFPLEETKWWQDDGTEKQLMRIKVLQIIRVDRYAGICEEIARVTDEKASTCICIVPTVDDVPSEKQLETFSVLAKYITIEVGTPGSNCNQVWAAKYHDWVQWFFPALKNVAVVEWISNKGFSEDGDIYDQKLDTCDQVGGAEDGELKPVCPCE